jgi:hypothetical protein
VPVHVAFVVVGVFAKRALDHSVMSSDVIFPQLGISGRIVTLGTFVRDVSLVFLGIMPDHVAFLRIPSRTIGTFDLSSGVMNHLVLNPMAATCSLVLTQMTFVEAINFLRTLWPSP